MVPIVVGSKGKEPTLKRTAVEDYQNAQLYCPAKINLHLQVGQLLGKGVQAFHRVCTLMQAVYLQGANELLQMRLSPRLGRPSQQSRNSATSPAPGPLQARTKLSLSRGQSLLEYRLSKKL